VAVGDASVILTEAPEGWRHDAYALVSARVEGDTLHVAVEYSGGCATHEFALLVSPSFMESYPVQMAGSLAHDAGGDPCRALVGSRLELDLSPTRSCTPSDDCSITDADVPGSDDPSQAWVRSSMAIPLGGGRL
jgi:hypothetical protein